MDKTNNDLQNICCIKDFISRYPHLRFTHDRFNYLLRNKKINGLLESGSLVKVGRAYFIDVVIFREWYSEYIKVN